MRTFGDKLKKLREDKNLTLKEAVDKIGISVSTLNSYEHDYKMPGLKTLIKIAKLYNTSLDYLIGIDELPNINKNKIFNELENIKNRIISLEEYLKNTK